MPYIHWELEDARNQMSTVIKDLQKANEEQIEKLAKRLATEYFFRLLSKKDTEQTAEQASKATEPDVVLLENYLFYEPPMHIRRTLDQFHYYTTDDTDVRDSDQVISRYLRRKSPDKPVPIVMVDQLWLWVLNNSKSKPSLPFDHVRE
jgi:hypothetical protein